VPEQFPEILDESIKTPVSSNSVAVERRNDRLIESGWPANITQTSHIADWLEVVSKPATVASLVAPLFLLLSTDVCLGQSIVESSSHGSSQKWPSPVRHAQYIESVQHIEADSGFDPVPMNAFRPPLHPHHVIMSPADQAADSDRIGGGRHGHDRDRLHVPHHLSHHAPFQTSSARLPRASLRKSWKTPYSYGYFGASGTRHWSLHHGYRDRYTEWRLR
jgi:hypothetical protein